MMKEKTLPVPAPMITSIKVMSKLHVLSVESVTVEGRVFLDTFRLSIWGRNLIHVLNVESALTRTPILSNTKEFTQERNHSLVRSVKSALEKSPTSSSMKECTPVRSHTLASSVANVSPRRPRWTLIIELTQARSHILVSNVTNTSPTREHLSATVGFIQERSPMNVPYVVSVSRTNQTWWSISGSIQGTTRICALNVAKASSPGPSISYMKRCTRERSLILALNAGKVLQRDSISWTTQDFTRGKSHLPVWTAASSLDRSRGWPNIRGKCTRLSPSSSESLFNWVPSLFVVFGCPSVFFYPWPGPVGLTSSSWNWCFFLGNGTWQESKLQIKVFLSHPNVWLSKRRPF